MSGHTAHGGIGIGYNHIRESVEFEKATKAENRYGRSLARSRRGYPSPTNSVQLLDPIDGPLVDHPVARRPS